MRKHLAILGLTLALTTLIYTRVSTAFFCGYDDFLEIQRADFVDRTDPAQIFTTTHFDSFKYRPLNRGSKPWSRTWSAPMTPIPTAFETCFFMRSRSWRFTAWDCCCLNPGLVAAIAALLFSLHPLANQVVVAAVFGNAEANALFLLTLVLFLLSLKRSSLPLFCLALVCGALSVYVYESSIAVAPIMAGWLALDYLFTKRLPPRRFLLVFVLLGGVLFGSYLMARQHFQSGGRTPIYGPKVIVKGAIEYAVALVVPVDFILAHDWFQTPLPTEVMPDEVRAAVLIGLVAGAVLIVIALYFFDAGSAACFDGAGWPQLLFLLLGMALSLGPFLVFSDHVSETYIYLPAAFYCLLLARMLAFIPSRGALVASRRRHWWDCLSPATWDRNQRVYACGATARRLLVESAVGGLEGRRVSYRRGEIA